MFFSHRWLFVVSALYQSFTYFILYIFQQRSKTCFPNDALSVDTSVTSTVRFEFPIFAALEKVTYLKILYLNSSNSFSHSSFYLWHCWVWSFWNLSWVFISWSNISKCSMITGGLEKCCWFFKGLKHVEITMNFFIYVMEKNELDDRK